MCYAPIGRGASACKSRCWRCSCETAGTLPTRSDFGGTRAFTGKFNEAVLERLQKVRCRQPSAPPPHLASLALTLLHSPPPLPSPPPAPQERDENLTARVGTRAAPRVEVVPLRQAGLLDLDQIGASAGASAVSDVDSHSEISGSWESMGDGEEESSEDELEGVTATLDEEWVMALASKNGISMEELREVEVRAGVCPASLHPHSR